MFKIGDDRFFFLYDDVAVFFDEDEFCSWFYFEFFPNVLRDDYLALCGYFD